MIFDLDFEREQRELDEWDENKGVPAFIDFHTYRLDGYRSDHFSKTLILRLHSAQDKLMNRNAVTDYLHARLVLKHRGYRVTRTGINRYPKIIERNEVKIRITTCKRMITKFTKQIHYYEEAEKGTLIPDWDNPKYIRIKEKINEYKAELKQLL